MGYNAGFAANQLAASNNLLIGYQSGDSITSGSDNIIIGYDEDTPSATTSNHLNIGSLIIGTIGSSSVTIKGALYIDEKIVYVDNSEQITAYHKLKTFLYKTTDESVANSTTLQDDDDLITALKANTVYQIEGRIHVESASATPDFKYAFSIPTGSTISLTGFGAEKAGAFFATDQHLDLEENTIALNAGVHSYLNFWGIVETNSTAGNIKLQWAQNASNATATILGKLSSIEIWEIE